VPADHGLGLHDGYRTQEGREHSIKAKEQCPVEPTQLHALGSPSPQNIELMPQDYDLGLQLCSRPEEVAQARQEQSRQGRHQAGLSSDSKSRRKSGQIEFSEWTRAERTLTEPAQPSLFRVRDRRRVDKANFRIRVVELFAPTARCRAQADRS